jgi:hypothetical protein
MIEPTEKNDPIANSDPKDPIEPTESAEPTDPIDKTEFFEPIERREPSDATDHLDRVVKRSDCLAPVIVLGILAMAAAAGSTRLMARSHLMS